MVKVLVNISITCIVENIFSKRSLSINTSYPIQVTKSLELYFIMSSKKIDHKECIEYLVNE